MIVGIDPGQNTGIAVLSSGVITATHTAKGLWEACTWINENVPRGTKIRIEDPTQNKPVFIPKKEMYLIQRGGPNAVSTARIFMRRAQNVGQNKQTTLHLVEWMELKGYRVERVRPTKYTGTKKSHEYVTSLFCAKHLKRTNEHVRDAIMLVVGME